MQVDIGRIRIPKRIRKDVGDLSPLKESMKKHGLLHPIIISRDFDLIAGYRRLRAAQELGWKTIEVRIVPIDDEMGMRELEMEENTTRKQLSLQEETDGYLLLNALEHPSLWMRIRLWFRRLWRAVRRWWEKRRG
ncbi:ParB domain protein nuclease [Spirochaeta thermophila DSM 6578]|uniref:ParB domain protein nuclease n=1 Tax=Winmispira thermophila (strain ATCC 700085 / DSM 6578 / Z-1203) TaxID=869211 RepID=G0GA18_WINT7|nr:ParB N-terminal domain-containing protein [Spirochaeta thermophila]AEJ61706.1 ParB domain protein nuclease [Spirochaeta thermophila DSM 6578]